MLKLAEFVRQSDRLHIHSMDRLARNLRDLQKIIENLNGKGVSVKFHKENLEFDGKANPMGILLMQVMGAVAEFELSIINSRRIEGVKSALRRGVKFGRAPISLMIANGGKSSPYLNRVRKRKPWLNVLGLAGKPYIESLKIFKQERSLGLSKPNYHCRSPLMLNQVVVIAYILKN